MDNENTVAGQPQQGNQKSATVDMPFAYFIILRGTYIECDKGEPGCFAVYRRASSSPVAPVAPIAPDAIRNAALDEAAGVCMRATPDRDHVRRIGEAAHYVACSNAILRLKKIPAPQQEGSEAGNGN